jgi:hypothetical protein
VYRRELFDIVCLVQEKLKSINSDIAKLNGTAWAIEIRLG